ncbi:Holliday junction DNA helicase RuvB [Mycoplasmoides fastidiosum]|uniref:Holliday junction DNA helicase RuvB n=1 Tax=Mycoplasmoides fastidiosum TaxID=92758 RepID=A0ABU0LZM4_9BACT|nr:Holliday junction branch migration DNA helicase RuvB [Mycoplasmoides fastidiosum]MDQ0514162.1 Holliday junction DNA helicase RuvB [Mycoplasmoides fastidiosum]UUD37428.1 Holliday junction branch migration DNA helicase RuvB [Mycoplasmoides fastidiosum]
MNAKLRPKSLDQFIGKPKIIQSIKIAIQACHKLQKPLNHCLFYGPAGVGKTTLALIIANELKTKIKIIQSVNLQNVADLISILSGIKDGEILFIDEIHSLNKNICEILYPVLEDGVLDIVIGKSFNSKVIRMKLAKFTLIGATTNLGLLTKALEDRFTYNFFIDSYNKEELGKIINQSLKHYQLKLNSTDIDMIINNSRGIPRIANKIINHIYNYSVVDKKINVSQIIEDSGYFIDGLTEIDLKYLKYLYEIPTRTAGLKSISQAINLDEKTILEKIESHLIKSKYLFKSSKGRTLSYKAISLIVNNQNLFTK